MAGASSNLEEIMEQVRKLADLVDLTRAGADKALGELVLDRVCERCIDRTINEQSGADGGYWPDNAPGYKMMKKKKGKIVSVLTGEMISETEIMGTREIEPKRAVVRYGKTEFARHKLGWFTRGSWGDGPGEKSGAKNQPPRPGLFMIDDIAKADVRAEIDDYIKYMLAKMSNS